jgi:hypothetical protein
MAERRLSRNSTSKQQLLPLLFAYDQIILSNTKDNMQKTAFKLNQIIITARGLTISVQKTKLMTLKGREPVRGKIVIDNEIVEQVNFFN